MRNAARPVLLAFLSAAIVLIASDLTVLHTMRDAAAAFDQTVRLAVHSLASPPLTGIVRGLTWLGSSWVLIPLAALSSVVLRRWFPLLAITLSELLTVSTKFIVRRPRPEAWFALRNPETWSFPSGHSLNSMVVYPVLGILLLPRLRTALAQKLVIAISILLPLFLGFTRIYLGVHWPTDVLTGWVAGACLAAGLIRAFRQGR